MSSHQLDEERIFYLAKEIQEKAARSEYLDQICAGDRALRERVEALLDVHEREQTFLRSNGALSLTEDREIVAAAGDQIGRFKLLQKIGEGGFGVVFMAEQHRPVRRKVALKVIKPGMDTRAVVGRFEAERQTLAMMDHPNIAKVFDGGETESGRPYFVMELVKGVPITAYCDDNRLRTSERLAIFVDVCNAVQHAHQKGVIHRDIKPSNVLVTLHDGSPVVKVIDFGVAKAMHSELTEKTLFTAFGQMIGTPQYMSPEQAEMSGLDVDTRSDVYSLGVLLYELLTGTTPIDVESIRKIGHAAMQQMIKEADPPRPSVRLSSAGEKLTHIAEHRKVSPDRLHREVRGELDWVVMKSLEKDRNRRYESAGQFASDVQNLLADRVVEARPPTLVYRLGKAWRRNRLLISSSTFVIVAILTILGLSIVYGSKYRAIVETLHQELIDRAVNQSANGEIDSAMKAIKQIETMNSSGRLTNTLKGISYATAGETDKAVEILDSLADDPDNKLAKLALVWTYYDAGQLNRAEELFGESRGVELGGADGAEADLTKMFFARIHAYTEKNDEAIDLLTDVLERNRVWGIGYSNRAEAYLSRFNKTKSFRDLERAYYDDYMASHLLPDSDTAKAYSLKLHVLGLQVAKALPGRVDDSVIAIRREKASQLARRFSETLSNWDGAAHALEFYRLTGQRNAADELEKRIEARFSQLQVIRDARMFVTRDLSGFRTVLQSDDNAFSRQMAALLIREDGERDAAIREVIASIQMANGNLDILNSAISMLDVLGENELREETCQLLTASNVWDVWWWQDVLGEYLRGELDEQELLEKAHPCGELLSLAHCYIGTAHLGQGYRETARQHFEEVVQIGRIGWGVYSRSKAFLNRMDNDPNWPEWIPVTTPERTQ